MKNGNSKFAGSGKAGMRDLPSSVETQKGLIGILVNEPISDYVIACEKRGVTDECFQAGELELWQEIRKAERETRPYDFASLANYLQLTRNGYGEKLTALLGECVSMSGNRSTNIPQYCEKLVETQRRRTLCLLGEKLQDAAKFQTDEYLAILDEIDAARQSRAGQGLPRIVSAADLCAKPPPTPPELIQGVLHKGSKMALGGGSKSFKTWTLLEMSLCIATGREWLGFPTRQGKVLYLNFELPEFSIASRIKEICEAMGINVPREFCLWNLRGHAADAATILPPISRQAQREDYSLLVLDPLYKLLGARDENASRDMANLMNEIERVAVDTGAAVAFGSHYSKGNQAGKESMDRISGSGVFARDPDSIITLTRHEEDDAFSVEMTLRNHPPQEPFVVRRQHPLMVIDGQLDPAKLKQVAGRKPTHQPDDLLKLLKGSMKDSEWKAAAAEHGFSRTTYYELKGRLLIAGKVFQSEIDEKWSRK